MAVPRHGSRPNASLDLESDNDGNWRVRAACANDEPEWWYPMRHPGTRTSVDEWAYPRMICGECSVATLCLEAALVEESDASVHYRWGMRGGKTPGERGAIARKREAVA